MGKNKEKVNFVDAVKNKKLPILTLDARWHVLFPDEAKTPQLHELEQEVNSYLKKQGKLVHEIKEMKKLKSNLMKEIVVNMDNGKDILSKEKEKKLDRNKQLIVDINTKIEEAMDELSDIPYLIKEVNEKLTIASAELCYERLNLNKVELVEINEWITSIREELKNKILHKQDLETKNNLIYTYMHDLLGVEVMEAFDREHQNDNKK